MRNRIAMFYSLTAILASSFFAVGGEVVSSVRSSAFPVDTVSVSNSTLTVDGSMLPLRLDYSPSIWNDLAGAGGSARITVNDETILEATQDGTFQWNPPIAGLYSIKHIAANVTTYSKQVNVAAPTVTIEREGYNLCKLTASDGVSQIHYTTDGTVPTVDSPLYTVPFEVPPSRLSLVRAATFAVGCPQGEAASAHFKPVASFVSVAQANCTIDNSGEIKQIGYDAIQLPYDTTWEGDANSSVELRVDGELIAEHSGAGDIAWTPERGGLASLALRTVDNFGGTVAEYSAQYDVVPRTVTITNSTDEIMPLNELYPGLCHWITNIVIESDSLVMVRPGLKQAKFNTRFDITSTLNDSEEVSDVSGVIAAYQKVTASPWQFTDPATGAAYAWNEQSSTFAYFGEMFMEAGKTYVFGAHFDDDAYVKVEGQVLINVQNSSSSSVNTGSYLCTMTGWHEVEFRLGDNTGGKGSWGNKWSVDFGLGYRDDGGTSTTQSEWKKLVDPGDGSLLRCRGGLLFRDCMNLTSITIPWKSVTQMRRILPDSYDKLETITLTGEPVEIPDNAFEGCAALRSIEIPSTVTKIGSSAFAGCSNLTEVEIPESVAQIGFMAFDGCTGLTNIVIEGESTFISYQQGLKQAKFNTRFDLTSTLDDSDEVSDVSGVIAAYQKVTASPWQFTDPVTGATYAWNESNSTFAYFGEMYMEAGKTYVFGAHFDDDVYVEVDGRVLINVSNTSQYNVHTGKFLCPATGWYGVEFRLGDNTGGKGSWGSKWSVDFGLGYRDDGGTSTTQSGWKKLVDPGDGSLFRSGGEVMFGNCPNLKSITIPWGIVTKMRRMFPDSYDKLEAIKLTGVPVEIPDNAFEGCAALRSIEIPSTVTKIGSSAFAGCSNLTEVAIPLGVKNIGYGEWGFVDASDMGRRLAYRSNAIGNNMRTEMSITVEGPLDWSFKWMVSSEKDYDWLSWSIDGVEKAKISGMDCGWQEVQCPIPDGEHVIRWAYTKDVYVASGDDCGWVAFDMPENMRTIFEGCSGLTSVTMPYRFRPWFGNAVNGCPITYMFAIQFEADGDNVEQRGVPCGFAIGKLPIVTPREGYSIAWFTAKTGGEQVTEETIAANDVTLYAQWTANEYEVSFDAAGGMVETAKKTVTFDAAYGELPTASCDGYVFLGWTLDDADVATDTIVITAADHTLIAKWGVQIGNGIWAATICDEPITLNAPVVPPSGDVAIPATVAGRTVVGITDAAFAGNAAVTGVTVRLGVDGIADGVLGDIPLTIVVENDAEEIPAAAKGTVRAVVFADGVTRISDNYFAGCVNLETFDIAESVVRIGTNVFEAASALETVVSNGLMLYQGWCLGLADEEADLYDITIPDGVRGIAAGAFEGEWEIESVEYPATLRFVGAGAFKDCTGIEDIALPEGVVAVDREAFRNCTWVQELSLPTTLREIGDGAFANCTMLTELTIPDGVADIGDVAFSNCWHITSAIIPASVTNVGAGAFAACKRLTDVTLPFGVGTVQEVFPAAYDKITRVEIASDGSDETMGVPPMPTGMFAGCTKLTDIIWPEGLGEISAEAFVGCVAMTGFNLPSSVTNIGARAFAGLSIEEIVFPASVAALGASVFDGCSSLASVRFLGNAPAYDAAAYAGAPAELVTYVVKGSRGWDGVPTSKALPEFWPEGTENEIWFWNPTRRTVDFIAVDGGGAVTTQRVEQVVGTTYVLPDAPSMDGAIFGGWWTLAEGGTRVTASTLVEADGPTAIYARLTFKRYTVTFDANGGEGAMAPVEMTVAVGAALPACGFSRAGYTFAGWATTQDGEVVYADVEEVVNLAHEQGATIVLYAKWSEITYAVAFDANGGVGAMEPVEMTVAVSTALPACGFSRAGYTFAGWATEADGDVVYADTEEVVSLAHEQGVTVVLYAKWTANRYTVTFDANGGDGAMEPMEMTVAVGAALPACGFSRADYTFAGWATEPDGDVVYADAEDVVNLAQEQGATIVLYAKWTDITYAVTFDAAGGSGGSAPVAVAYGAALPSVVVPTRAGYTFGGYWLEMDGDMIQYFSSDGAGLRTWDRRAAATLTARWTANTITYTYQSMSGSEIKLTGYSGTVPADVMLPSKIDGKTVVGIGEGFMEECEDLVSLTFPSTIRFVEEDAFDECDNLAILTLNEGLETIERKAFRSCISMTSVVLPSTVRAIGEKAFTGSNEVERSPNLRRGGISSISIKGGDNNWFSTSGGVLYDKVNKMVIMSVMCKSEISIPAGCERIGEKACQSCHIQSISFPSSLKSIGREAFGGCQLLEAVDLSCTKVVTLEDRVFIDCLSLIDVRFPATLEEVGVYLFGNATALKSVYYAGNAPVVNIDLGWGSEYVEENAPYFPEGDIYVARKSPAFFDDEAPYDARLTEVVSYVVKSTAGWWLVPGTWQGCPVRFMEDIEPTDPMPEVAIDADAATVNAAVDGVGFADATVKAAIGGSAAEYNAFRTWAESVKGASGSSAAAGEAAVVASPHAAAAYLLGAERLFENEPTVAIDELAVSDGESAGTTAMTVSATIKDGDQTVTVDAAKVAAMFEATSDLTDWNGAAKLTPGVVVEDGEGATMRFKVTPGDGSAPRAFLRIRK